MYALAMRYTYIRPLMSLVLGGALTGACVEPPKAGSPSAVSTAAASAASAPAASTQVAAAPSTTSAPVASTQVSIDIPVSDDGLPGAGPIRRADWFRKIWKERRSLWLKRTTTDHGAIVFLGDSITQMWGDDFGGSFADLHVANRGISGDTTRGVLIRLDRDVIALHPSAVVVLIGTNDIEEGAAPDTIAGNLRLIIEALERADPGISILVCEVFPSSTSKRRPAATIIELNQRYAALAKQDRHIKLVHTWAGFADASGNATPSEFPDLLHPNAAGYAKWAGALRPYLAEIKGAKPAQ